MDKLAKRVMYNPDGSLVMKRWDDTLVVKGKQESALIPNSAVRTSLNNERNPVDMQMMDELDEFEERYLDEIGYNWATEIDY